MYRELMGNWLKAHNMEDNKPIGFAIDNFRIKQFATLPGYDSEQEEYNLSLQINFSVDPTKKILGTSLTANFLSKSGEPFIICTVEGLFTVDPESWENLLNETRDVYIIPVHLARHLSVITTGTLRGVLLTRVIDSAPEYASFILPTINLTEIIEEDAILPIFEEE